jgi:cysteine desulfuration protein SufE
VKRAKVIHQPREIAWPTLSTVGTRKAGAFRALGLEQHLTPQRSNGARAMIERIRADAAAA